MWLRHHSFKQNVKSWWDEEVTEKWAGLKIQRKLKNLKEKLKLWNWTTFGNIRLKKEELLYTIQNLDKDEERGDFSEEKRLARSKPKEEFQQLALRKEINWRQKSRMQWLRHEDSNTKYFHSFANRQTIYHISSLIINGSACDDQKMIEDEIISFYKRLYTANQQPAAYSSSWSGKCLSPKKRSWLKDLF